MEIGVTFPMTEIGTQTETVAQFARMAEKQGYGHLLTSDHVLGVNANRDGGWDGPYDHTDQFHEPLTLFGYLAGVTSELDLITGILVLPQRQTALVAKQAAQIDKLSNGRLRIGVGVGWNPLEYVALGEEFKHRGKRIEEQVMLLRQLWTQNPITFEGEFHELPDMGINPLPEQQPIPIWMGGSADIVLKRIAQIADGWIARDTPEGELREQLATLRKYTEEEGRDIDDIGVHGQLRLDTTDTDELVERIETWEELDADYLSVLTLEQDMSPVEHIDAIKSFAESMADVGIELSS